MDQQRRRVPRERAGWTGRYRFGQAVDSPAGWYECRILDLSLIGAGIELYGPIPDDAMDQQVVVEAQSPTGGSISLRLRGACRYLAPGSTGGTRVGIEFTELSETERSILDVLRRMQVVF